MCIIKLIMYSYMSLRSSESGLKSEEYFMGLGTSKSLRSSERGLKFEYIVALRGVDMSLRSSERGLKCGKIGTDIIIGCRSVRRSVD